MMKRFNIPLIVLWLWVLAVTILMGGGIFEHLVLTPLWAGSPPESVTQWPYGVVQAKFFGVVTLLTGLLSLALIIVSWWRPRRQRKWALVAGVSSQALGNIIEWVDERKSSVSFSFVMPVNFKSV